jgi:DNA-binding NarL/FixJ family response regulator
VIRTPLSDLASAVAALEDEGTVLELVTKELADECPRGTAVAFTCRGPRSSALGLMRVLHAGKYFKLTLPEEAHRKTPAYDVANVPPEQRNRWVEPFRDGIASRESFKRSTIYPFVQRFGILDQGRIAVCNAQVQVAAAIVGIPEGTEFSTAERARLSARAATLVVSLRVCALLANAKSASSALEQLLATRADVVVVTDGRGAILGASRRAEPVLDREPSLANAVARAVRSPKQPFRAGRRVLYASPCSGRGTSAAFIVAIDEASRTTQKPLSPRQLELLGQLERGLSNAEVAEAMLIAPATVKTMLERLYRQANVSNRVELIAWSRGK